MAETQQIFLEPCADDLAREHFQRTVREGVSIRTLDNFTDKEFDTETVPVWGTNVGSWESIRKGDYVLFYQDKKYIATGKVDQKEPNEPLAEELWPDLSGDHLTEKIIYFSEVYEISLPTDEYARLAGYQLDHNPPRFNKSGEAALAKIRTQFGSIPDYIESITDSKLFLSAIPDGKIQEFNETVQHPVTLWDEEDDDLHNRFAQVVQNPPIGLLEAAEAEQESRIWSSPDTPPVRRAFKELEPGDVILFYHDNEYIASGRVGRTFENQAFADELRGGSVSPLLYTVRDFHEFSVGPERIKEDIGYDAVPDDELEKVEDRVLAELLEEYTTVEAFLRDVRGEPIIRTTQPPRQSSSPRVDEQEKAGDLQPPKTVETQISRVIRNTSLVKELKQKYDYECQVCEKARKRSPQEKYAEGHHLHPLGESGPDRERNILILCPNHHADFDYGMIEVDPQTLEVTHAYDDDLTGTQLTVHPDHDLAKEYLRYHNQNQVKFRP